MAQQLLKETVVYFVILQLHTIFPLHINLRMRRSPATSKACSKIPHELFQPTAFLSWEVTMFLRLMRALFQREGSWELIQRLNLARYQQHLTLILFIQGYFQHPLAKSDPEVGQYQRTNQKDAVTIPGQTHRALRLQARGGDWPKTNFSLGTLIPLSSLCKDCRIGQVSKAKSGAGAYLSHFKSLTEAARPSLYRSTKEIQLTRLKLAALNTSHYLERANTLRTEEVL